MVAPNPQPRRTTKPTPPSTPKHIAGINERGRAVCLHGVQVARAGKLGYDPRRSDPPTPFLRMRDVSHAMDIKSSPNTLHPTPYTLHLTPSTLHPKTQTPNPKPQPTNPKPAPPPPPPPRQASPCSTYPSRCASSTITSHQHMEKLTAVVDFIFFITLEPRVRDTKVYEP